MTQNLFSVPIFFIVWRETLEAAIIISVLLGLVEQLVRDDGAEKEAAAVAYIDDKRHSRSASVNASYEKHSDGDGSHIGNSPARKGGFFARLFRKSGRDDGGLPTTIPFLSRNRHNNNADVDDVELDKRRLIRKLRLQIVIGSCIGLIVALALGGAFIAVWFTKASDLWSKSEALWEGIFSLVASLIILVMGVTMLKLEGKRVKWRIKMIKAFNERGIARANRAKSGAGDEEEAEDAELQKQVKAGKWALLLLPLITVLREGIEAVVFVGGVALGQPAASIPIATICGILVGLVCGWLIYSFASRATLTTFLIVMTNFILLIGAGLFSKAVGEFQENAFNKMLGADVDDAGGNGPGSFDVRGNVWHLECCNPEDTTGNTSQGWMIFNAVLGWTNNATLGSVLSYIFYWLAAIAILVYMKWKEGRVSLLGRKSERGMKRQERKRLAAEQRDEGVVSSINGPAASVASARASEKEAHGVHDERAHDSEIKEDMFEIGDSEPEDDVHGKVLVSDSEGEGGRSADLSAIEEERLSRSL